MLGVRRRHLLQQLAAEAKAEEDDGLTHPLTDGDFAVEDN